MSTPQLGNEMCTFLQTFWSVSYCGANCFPSWWPWFSECDMLRSVSMANMGQAQKLGRHTFTKSHLPHHHHHIHHTH